MRTCKLALAIGLGILTTSAALAKKPPAPPPPPPPSVTQCKVTDISVKALGCSGFVAGNVINSSKADVTTQDNALKALGLTNWNGLTVASFTGLKGATDISFSKPLTGLTYIGVHYGNGQGGPGNATAFYVLDAAQGLNRIHLNYAASSNLVVYATGIGIPVTAVPETATWAMMVGGFGLVGAGMRSRRKALTFA